MCRAGRCCAVAEGGRNRKLPGHGWVVTGDVADSSFVYRCLWCGIWALSGVALGVEENAPCKSFRGPGERGGPNQLLRVLETS